MELCLYTNPTKLLVHTRGFCSGNACQDNGVVNKVTDWDSGGLGLNHHSATETHWVCGTDHNGL